MTDDRDVVDAAWILIHHVDDHRATDIVKLIEQARLLVAVADRRDAVEAGPRWPHYFSTYCIHGLHTECRQTCKTCEKPCVCECHR